MVWAPSAPARFDEYASDIEKHGAEIAALQDDLRLKEEQEHALRRELKDTRLKNEELRHSSSERLSFVTCHSRSPMQSPAT